MRWKWCFLIMLLGFTVLEGMAEEKRPLVFKVDVKDEIGPEIWRLVKKSFEKAEQEKADYILIDMNTYGGMVVYADSLRSLILNSSRPVWVFINNNAASAGCIDCDCL